MVTEIKYRGERFSVVHDGEEYSLPEVLEHFKQNGHCRERPCFCVPFKVYEVAFGFSERVDELFDGRKSRAK